MKLKHKIIALNVGTLILILFTLGTIVVRVTDNNNLLTVLNYLESQGEYASIYVDQYASNKAHNVFEVPSIMLTDANYLAAFLKKTANCRVQIFYGYDLLGDSEENASSDKMVRGEVSQTFQKNSAYLITKTGKNRTFYYATPVNIGNRYTYSIAFIYDLSETDKMKRTTINILLLIGFLCSIFIVIISTAISNRITRPINTLNQATRLFSKGNLGSRANVTTNDEVGELSTAFNSMADNIQDMIEKLNYEKEKQKSFFDNFTHEMRTPLTTILGYSELLWKTDDEQVRDKSLFHITSEGKRLLKMVERLLELSKLKQYNFEIKKAPTDLKKLIEDVCDAMQYKVKRYNTSINLQLEAVSCNVDPDLFKQVLINIIDNSIKYSRSDKIDIALCKKEKIHLTITDYGQGIDPRELENLFEPYYKVDKSRNSHIEGWGLGLSIAKEIITKHEGTIELLSSPQEGTRVEIVI